MCPTTPQELASALAMFAQDATGPQRTLTLARYAILVEAGIRPSLRAQLAVTGARVNAWFMNWLRIAGSTDPERDGPIVMNHWTGLVLHQLARPDPEFDPSAQLTALVTAVVRPCPAEVPCMTSQQPSSPVVMNSDQVWQVIDAQRMAVADLLEKLSDNEWQQPSLCAGWTVRDVAAHLTLQQLGLGDADRDDDQVARQP